MNHSFHPSTSVPDSCTVCKYPEITHTDHAECEAGNCPSGPTKVEIRYGNMLMCESCWQRELAVTAKHMSPEAQKARLDAYLAQSKAIDEKVQTKMDIFNSEAIPAVELRASINNNTEMDQLQKDHLYAKTCMERFIGLKQAVFGKREELLKMENEMRMWQVQVRTVASLLSAELKAQFQASDVTYNPPVTKVTKPAAPKIPKKRYSPDELLAACKKYDVPMAAVQMFVTSKNMSPEDAAMHLRRMMDKTEVKS